jgi:hypothetical protein
MGNLSKFRLVFILVVGFILLLSIVVDAKTTVKLSSITKQIKKNINTKVQKILGIAPKAASASLSAGASSEPLASDRISLAIKDENNISTETLIEGHNYTLIVNVSGVGWSPTWDVAWSIEKIPSYLNFGNGIGGRPPKDVDFFEGNYVPIAKYSITNIFLLQNAIGVNYANASTNKSWSPVAYYNFTVNYSELGPIFTSLTLTPYATFLADNVSGSYSWQLSGRNIDFNFTIWSQAYYRAARCNGADMTGDKVVDGLDYGKWQASYGQSNCEVSNNWCNWGDANKDGVVDGLDYGVWQANYQHHDCVIL